MEQPQLDNSCPWASKDPQKVETWLCLVQNEHWCLCSARGHVVLHTREATRYSCSTRSFADYSLYELDDLWIKHQVSEATLRNSPSPFALFLLYSWRKKAGLLVMWSGFSLHTVPSVRPLLLALLAAARQKFAPVPPGIHAGTLRTEPSWASPPALTEQGLWPDSTLGFSASRLWCVYEGIVDHNPEQGVWRSCRWTQHDRAIRNNDKRVFATMRTNIPFYRQTLPVIFTTFTHNKVRQNGTCHKLHNRDHGGTTSSICSLLEFFGFGFFVFFNRKTVPKHRSLEKFNNCSESTTRTSTWCKHKSISSAVAPLPCLVAFFHQITDVFIPNTYSHRCATHTHLTISTVTWHHNPQKPAIQTMEHCAALLLRLPFFHGNILYVPLFPVHTYNEVFIISFNKHLLKPTKIPKKRIKTRNSFVVTLVCTTKSCIYDTIKWVDQLWAPDYHWWVGQKAIIARE